MSRKKRKNVYSGIGGQAVLEGVMMRNKNIYAVAVRQPDGSISVESRKLKDKGKNIAGKIPIIRGIVSFVDSLSLGMDILSYSASFFEDEEETAFDRLLKKIFGKHAESVVMGFTVLLSIIIAAAFFMVLPYALSALLEKYVQSEFLVLVIEGILRLLVFLIYVSAITLSKDIKRLYQYHGAEHKCINCIETGRELTVRNVRKSSRFHKRCGTSFMLFIVMISIILCFFIKSDSRLLMILYRLLIIPVVAGISYEILRASGTHDNFLLDIISAPGLLLQRITTKEPDDEMIEVAIASVEAVFNWRKFEKRHFRRTRKKKRRDEGAQVNEINESDILSADELPDASEMPEMTYEEQSAVSEEEMEAAYEETENYEDEEGGVSGDTEEITVLDYKDVSYDTYMLPVINESDLKRPEATDGDNNGDEE